MNDGQILFTGWGRTARSRAVQSTVRTVDEAREVVSRLANLDVTGRGVIARGLGRSYGDQAQNSGGRVLVASESTDDANEFTGIDLDPQLGIAICGGGVSLEDLIRRVIPTGWFVPVTPGTRYVTIGGAIANDIHGKNHHQGGSFGEYVESLELLLSSGELIHCSPQINRDVFLATVGGAGLTGLICRAVVRLKRIESSLMSVLTERAKNLEDLMEKLVASEKSCEYTVAWIDLLSTGKNLGRGIVLAGNHATSQDGEKANTFDYVAKSRLVAPPAPSGLLNKLTIRAFNELWYRKAPSRPSQSLESIPSFFHPLDGVRDWNRLYGSRGFIQYQFVLPESENVLLRDIISRFSETGVASFLAVLKRLGPGSEAFLSFPKPGWTLALDIPANSGLQSFLDDLDRQIVAVGGRHYMAKDSHMRRSVFEAGYENLPKWKEIKAEVDPKGMWVSDAGRRLGLC